MRLRRLSLPALFTEPEEEADPVTDVATVNPSVEVAQIYAAPLPQDYQSAPIPVVLNDLSQFQGATLQDGMARYQMQNGDPVLILTGAQAQRSLADIVGDASAEPEVRYVTRPRSFFGKLYPIVATPFALLGLVALLFIGLGGYQLYQQGKSAMGAASSTATNIKDAFTPVKQSSVEQIVSGKTWTAFDVVSAKQEMTIKTNYCEGFGFTTADESCKPKDGATGWLLRAIGGKSAHVMLVGSVWYSYDLTTATGVAGSTPDSLTITVPKAQITPVLDLTKSTFGESSKSLSSIVTDPSATDAIGQAQLKMVKAAESDTKLAETARAHLETNLEHIYAANGKDVDVTVIVAGS